MQSNSSKTTVTGRTPTRPVLQNIKPKLTNPSEVLVEVEEALTEIVTRLEAKGAFIPPQDTIPYYRALLGGVRKAIKIGGGK